VPTLGAATRLPPPAPVQLRPPGPPLADHARALPHRSQCRRVFWITSVCLRSMKAMIVSSAAAQRTTNRIHFVNLLEGGDF